MEEHRNALNNAVVNYKTEARNECSPQGMDWRRLSSTRTDIVDDKMTSPKKYSTLMSPDELNNRGYQKLLR